MGSEPAQSEPWHSLAPQAVADQLGSDGAAGLTPGEAAAGLIRHGPNELRRVGARPWFVVLFNQFFDILILILLIAAGVSLVIGNPVDALALGRCLPYNA